MSKQIVKEEGEEKKEGEEEKEREKEETEREENWVGRDGEKRFTNVLCFINEIKLYTVTSAVYGKTVTLPLTTRTGRRMSEIKIP